MASSVFRLRLLMLFLFFCPVLLAGDLVGVVSVVDKKGRQMDLKDDRVIVFLEGRPAALSKRDMERSYTMNAIDKQFEPRVLIVPKGATVSFPNSDPIIHNVFSVSGKNRFDAGRFGKGNGASHKFTSPGLVRVYCNVHHQMNAIIYVAENPWYAYVEPDGAFTIKNPPPGEWRITALHRVAGKTSKNLTIGQGDHPPLTLELAAQRKRLKRHLNKHGKPYKKRRSEKY